MSQTARNLSATAPFDETTGAWSAPLADAAAIERLQIERAWQVAEAARRSPFYRDRLAGLPAERTRAAFETLPRIAKPDVVADCSAHPPYGSRFADAPDTIRSFAETSGTSGKGKAVFALNQADLDAIYQTEAIGFWWAGVRPGDGVLLTVPIGVTAAGRWYDGGLRLIGANVMSVGSYPTERKVEVLARYGATTVVGTPSYVYRLAHACVDAGLAPSSLGVRSLVIAGERYSRRWVEDMQSLWGATVYEQYGCTERAIAWTCPGGVLRGDGMAVLHFPAEGALCEVVDPDTGRAVAHGERGELTVTPFSASASPLVRYRTGDRVQYVAPGECECGRPLAGIVPGRVERFDDMLKIRGLNVWPESFDAAIFGVPGVRDYRGAVESDAQGGEVVSVEVECDAAESDRVTRDVVGSVRTVLGMGVRVTIVEPGSLAARVPEGFVKVARWSDRRASWQEQNGAHT